MVFSSLTLPPDFKSVKYVENFFYFFLALPLWNYLIKASHEVHYDQRPYSSIKK